MSQQAQQTPRPMMFTIVLAKVEMTGLRKTGRLVRRDLNWFPEMEACPEAKACVWLRSGDESDYRKAKAFADSEGYQVLVFPTDEKEPLEKARRQVLASKGAST